MKKNENEPLRFLLYFTHKPGGTVDQEHSGHLSVAQGRWEITLYNDATRPADEGEVDKHHISMLEGRGILMVKTNGDTALQLQMTNDSGKQSVIKLQRDGSINTETNEMGLEFRDNSVRQQGGEEGK